MENTKSSQTERPKLEINPLYLAHWTFSLRPSRLEDQREVRKAIDLLTNGSIKDTYYCVVDIGDS